MVLPMLLVMNAGSEKWTDLCVKSHSPIRYAILDLRTDAFTHGQLYTALPSAELSRHSDSDVIVSDK
jgi:hypothetical protein